MLIGRVFTMNTFTHRFIVILSVALNLILPALLSFSYINLEMSLLNFCPAFIEMSTDIASTFQTSSFYGTAATN